MSCSQVRVGNAIIAAPCGDRGFRGTSLLIYLQLVDKRKLREEEWRKRPSPDEYHVLRQHGTERPWERCFIGTNEPGTYVCAACGNPLFRSGEKFESGTGWPSFTRPVSADAIASTRTAAMAWPAQRSGVPAATAISVTSSQRGRRRRDCGTASTRS